MLRQMPCQQRICVCAASESVQMLSFDIGCQPACVGLHDLSWRYFGRRSIIAFIIFPTIYYYDNGEIYGSSNVDKQVILFNCAVIDTIRSTDGMFAIRERSKLECTSKTSCSRVNCISQVPIWIEFKHTMCDANGLPTTSSACEYVFA